MKHITASALLLAVLASGASGQESAEYPCDTASVSVFVAKDGNPYESIRIPSLINIGGKRLMAVAEGRYTNTDQGQNDIIMSISEDGGETWSRPKVIAEAKGATFNNPCPVYDAKRKTITIVFQRYPEGVKERTPGIPFGWDDGRCLRNFMIQSTDGGETWCAPIDITKTTKRRTGVDIMATGPNAGVQLHGRNKGRLVVPMNEGPFGKWVISCIYSDDGGKTWKISDPADNMRGQVNETSIAETDTGVVMVARRWGSASCKRIVWSQNGGKSWGPVQEAKELFCDNTQNSLFTYSLKGQKNLGGKTRIIFSGPGANRRRDGTVCISYDNGKTWPVKKKIGTGGFAYSSIAFVEPGKIGILYEENSNRIRNLKFVPLTIEWLTDGKDTGKAKEAGK